MKEQLITTTQAVDPVFQFILGSCIVLLAAITIVMIWFVIRYRRSREPKPTSDVHSNTWLEIVWTVLPLMLVMTMFYYGWASYLYLTRMPEGALQTTAVARMWSWNFLYDNGKSSSKLYVPVGRPVVVNLESKDVLHGFYVPAFRVKRDVVPGVKNQVWFVADKPGSYDIFCSVYCGTQHSAMITTIEALPEEQFEAWYGSTAPAGEDVEGRALLEKYGCLGCHSLDGSKKIGPTFQGIASRRVSVTRDGQQSEQQIGAAYLRESIVAPAAAIVVGYPPIMPASEMKGEELEEVIEYLMEQK